MAHLIRLRGPWDVERSKTEDNRARVKLTRHFGSSDGLKSAQQVWLSIKEVAGRATIGLNGRSLGEIISHGATYESHAQRCPAKFDITALLQPRNLLVIDLLTTDQSTDAGDAACVGLVQLEID